MQNSGKVMNRSELTARLVARLTNEEAVVAGIGWTNFALWEAGRRPQNFYMLGSMGLAFPIALGVALAQPQRRVVGLEGDGSVLMQLGALGTIASEAPKNLLMIVWDNGAYQITGGQKAVTSSVADLVAVARGLGIAESHLAADESDFDALVDRGLAATVPFLIAAKIDASRPGATTHRDAALIRENFMRGIGTRTNPFAET